MSHNHEHDHHHDDHEHKHKELKLNAKGEDVLHLQWKLKSLNYYKGKLDSEFGPETEKAVKAFQSEHKLKEDGVFGSVSAKAYSDKVKHLQHTLNHVGYELKVDGEFGPLTQEAVKKFQEHNKLEVNGVFCQNCCNTLSTHVKTLQTYLWHYGAYHGKVDGHLGYWTVQAIKTFQKYLRLKEDGVAGHITHGKLKESTFHLGWTLKSFGYNVTPSGDFNTELETALKAFQKDKKLKEDGVFGVVSYHALHNHVKHMQWTLSSLGVELGKADGEFGPLTQNGVKEYQTRHKLKTVDGIYNSETKTSVEENVKALQSKLGFLGADVGPADGLLGPRSHEAILTYQKHHDLKQDGIVGMITWHSIIKHVKHAQYALKHLGFSVDINGNSDEKTLAATKEFQKSKNIVVDGVYGPLTHNQVERATKRIQRHLIGVGFDVGKAGADGAFGPFTENAVKEFQKEVGLETNGVFCQKTLEKMQEWVKKIQTELTKRKHDCGEVDGIFGYLTQSAVKEFQKQNDLVVDGIAGRVTRAKLFK